MAYQHSLFVATFSTLRALSTPSKLRWIQSRYLFTALTLTISTYSLPASANSLDWVWDNQPSSNYCAGQYIPTSFDILDADLPANSQPIYTNSDTSEFANGVTKMQGNVVMQRGDQLLKSELVSLDNNTGIIYVEDKVEYRRPGLIINATNGTFDTNLNQANLNQAELAQFDSELRAAADQVVVNSDDTMVLKNGKFSFCPPGDNSWHISSSKINVLPAQGVGEARHAVLNLGSVPIFYLPWLSFPIDDARRSGFLYPKISLSNDNGLYLATPYYLNLASNYDAVLTPHWREDRGLYLSAHGRYLSQVGLQEIKTIASVDDKLNQQQRWYIDYQYSNQINDRLYADIKLARASDIDLFDDYDYLSTQADDHKVSSQIVFKYQFDQPWLKTGTIGFKQHQQLTESAPSYNLRPYIDMHANGRTKGSYAWQYHLNYSHFERDSDGTYLTAMQKMNGKRTHFTPSISYQWQTDYAFVSPKLTTPLSIYELTNTPTGVATHQTRGLYQLELDSGLYFDRITQSGGQQTLEPRLYWAYAPYRNQSNLPVFDTSAVSKPLYQPNRFSGSDRIADTNRVTVGLTSRVLGENGEQEAKFSLAQIHYFDDHQVKLTEEISTFAETSSPIYGQMDYQINRQLRTNISIDWDSTKGGPEEVSANMQYQAASNKVITASYTETASSRQNQLSIIWPMAPQWTLFGQYKGDLINQSKLDQIAGVEYANCCWKARLINRDWIQDTERQHGIFLELELTGLGDSDTRLFGTGNANIEEFMSNITGYNERFN